MAVQWKKKQEKTMLIKTRRNGGRLLVVAIESADNKGLTGRRDLLLTTVDNLKMRGYSTAKCPSDVLLALSGVGVKDRRVQFDDDGEEHVFVVCDCGDFDLMLGLSSRRETNLRGQGSGNLATNTLIDVLSIPDESAPWRPLYGEVMAQDLNRLWRNEVGSAHIQQHCEDWDIVLWSVNDRLDFSLPGSKLAGLHRYTNLNLYSRGDNHRDRRLVRIIRSGSSNNSGTRSGVANPNSRRQETIRSALVRFRATHSSISAVARGYP